jgi:hypothetical protein
VKKEMRRKPAYLVTTLFDEFNVSCNYLKKENYRSFTQNVEVH